jgi:predicted dehydrogenase
MTREYPSPVVRILIVGGGNIGSRHLQGLESLSESARVFVVDPSPSSLETARERWNEVGREDHDVSYVNSVEDVGLDHVDVAIIATPSSVRRSAFEEVVDHLAVDFVLFEKVLFQRVEDYDAVASLLDERGIDAWVNCLRRLNDTYRAIASSVGEGPVDVTVTGNAWRLGSNAIHFVDLFGWFTGSRDLIVDTAGLVESPTESGRDGFTEFHGRLDASDGLGNTLCLRCFEQGPPNISVHVSTPTDRWSVHETDEIVTTRRHTNENECNVEDSSFSLTYQSELTGDVVDEILAGGDSSLPTYEESCAYHVPLIEALLDYLNRGRDEALTSCPIT